MGINNKSPHRELAWDFIKFMNGYEGHRRLCAAGYVPVRKSVANDVFFKKDRSGRYAVDPQNKSVVFEAYQLARDAEREVLCTYERATVAANGLALKKSLLLITAMERHELDEIEGLFDFTNVPNQSLSWGEFSNLDEFHDFGRYGST